VPDHGVHGNNPLGRMNATETEAARRLGHQGGHLASILAMIRSAMVIASAMQASNARRRSAVPVCKPPGRRDCRRNQQNALSTLIHSQVVTHFEGSSHCKVADRRRVLVRLPTIRIFAD
jgi:hypothetical protein